MKLLIVDDDATLLEALTEVLSLNGHTVVQAADGIAALQLALEAQPDTILSDFEMPQMDGLTLHRRLREIPETRHIMFVLMTGSIQLSELQEKGAAFLDAIPILRKPFEMEQLLEILGLAPGESTGMGV